MFKAVARIGVLAAMVAISVPAASARHHSGYAHCRAQAERISGYHGPEPERNRHAALRGAARGAATGAILGAVVDGDAGKAARRGAVTGAVVGGIRRNRAERRAEQRRAEYERQLDLCMAASRH